MTLSNAVIAAESTDSHRKCGGPKHKANFGSLRMIGHFTIRYPRQIVFALIALVAAASSTLAIPYGLRLVIDEGFVKNGGDPAPYFYLLLGIVVIIGISTAFRFYFVSWLGERVVGDIRVAVQKQSAAAGTALF